MRSLYCLKKNSAFTFLSGIFAVSILIWLYAPFLSAHFKESFNPYSFSDDARHHIAPFLTYWDDELFKNDYPTQYYLDALSPTLWKATYYLASFFVDPIKFSNFIPYPLWIVTIFGIAFIIYRIGGWASAFGTLLFAIPAPVFFDRMSGGLSRCFAFPFLVWGIYFLITSRYKLLSLITILAAGFYPTPAIILSVMLFCGLLHKHIIGSSKSNNYKNTFIILGITAIGCLTMFLPPLLAAKNYGDRLTEHDLINYPELGEGGRYGNSEHGPHISYLQGLIRYTQSTFLPRREPYLESFLKESGIVQNNRRSFLFRIKTEIVNYLGLTIVCGLIYFYFLKKEERGIGLSAIFIFACSAFTTHLASILLYPQLFFPQRYIVYTTPLLALLIYGTALGCLSKVLKTSNHNKDILIMGISLFALFIFGGPSKENEGYVTIDKKLIPLYKHLETLPKNSIVAGWPKGPISNVAYLSRRPTFLTIEINQAFHQGYLDEMRKRMRALLPAYFTKNELAPLLELRDTHHVTHLIVDLSHFKDNPPKYFLPFSDQIPQYFEGSKYEDFAIPKLIETSSTYRSGNLAVIDLARLTY